MYVVLDGLGPLGFFVCEKSAARNTACFFGYCEVFELVHETRKRNFLASIQVNNDKGMDVYNIFSRPLPL